MKGAIERDRRKRELPKKLKFYFSKKRNVFLFIGSVFVVKAGLHNSNLMVGPINKKIVMPKVRN